MTHQQRWSPSTSEEAVKFQDAKNDIMGILIGSKEGLKVRRLLSTLNDNGIEIPYRKLGFNSFNQFLFQCEDIIEVRMYPGGYSPDLFLFVRENKVPDEMKHIREQVLGQAAPKRNGRSNTPRPTRRNTVTVDSTVLFQPPNPNYMVARNPMPMTNYGGGAGGYGGGSGGRGKRPMYSNSRSTLYSQVRRPVTAPFRTQNQNRMRSFEAPDRVLRNPLTTRPIADWKASLLKQDAKENKYEDDGGWDDVDSNTQQSQNASTYKRDSLPVNLASNTKYGDLALDVDSDGTYSSDEFELGGPPYGICLPVQSLSPPPPTKTVSAAPVPLLSIPFAKPATSYATAESKRFSQQPPKPLQLPVKQPGSSTSASSSFNPRPGGIPAVSKPPVPVQPKPIPPSTSTPQAMRPGSTQAPAAPPKPLAPMPSKPILPSTPQVTRPGSIPVLPTSSPPSPQPPVQTQYPSHLNGVLNPSPNLPNEMIKRRRFIWRSKMSGINTIEPYHPPSFLKANADGKEKSLQFHHPKSKILFDMIKPKVLYVLDILEFEDDSIYFTVTPRNETDIGKHEEEKKKVNAWYRHFQMKPVPPEDFIDEGFYVGLDPATQVYKRIQLDLKTKGPESYVEVTFVDYGEFGLVREDCIFYMTKLLAENPRSPCMGKLIIHEDGEPQESGMFSHYYVEMRNPGGDKFTVYYGCNEKNCLPVVSFVKDEGFGKKEKVA